MTVQYQHINMAVKVSHYVVGELRQWVVDAHEAGQLAYHRKWGTSKAAWGRGATRCVVKVRGRTGIGYSFCSPDDNFNKKIGRGRAYQRALASMEVTVSDMGRLVLAIKRELFPHLNGDR